MTTWKNAQQRQRWLEAWQVRRILSRGGMLIGQGSVWKAYRSQDARRMCVGRVEAGLAAALVACGAARQLESLPPRVVAATCAPAWSDVRSSGHRLSERHRDKTRL